MNKKKRKEVKFHVLYDEFSIFLVLFLLIVCIKVEMKWKSFIFFNSLLFLLSIFVNMASNMALLENTDIALFSNFIIIYLFLRGVDCSARK